MRRRAVLTVVLALTVIPAMAIMASSQGRGPASPKDLRCAPAKRAAALRKDQSAVESRLGRLTELRSRADLGALAAEGYSSMPKRFTSVKGIGVTVANPVTQLAPGNPNQLYYAPAVRAARASDPGGPDFPYTLVGWGYAVPYAPDHVPALLPCVGTADWHVHERGIDAAGSGRTVVMAPSESGAGEGFGALSEPPALGAVVGVPHPRRWSVHFWRGANGTPSSSILDREDPAPGVDPQVGANFYRPKKAPTAVLDATATGAPVGLQPGEGAKSRVGGGTHTFKATAFNQGGSLSIVEAELPAGSERPDSGPVGHDEGWYLLDGAITFKAGNRTLSARKGSFAYLPAGLDYSLEVDGGTARAVYVTATGRAPRRTRSRPYVLDPGAGEQLTISGHPYYLKATKKGTGGVFSVIEINQERGTAPQPHIHHKEVEAFYLLDGEMTFTSAGQTLTAQKGGFVQLPVGLPHSYETDGDGEARALLITLPGGLEDFFRILDKAGGNRPNPSQLRPTGVEPAIRPPAG